MKITYRHTRLALLLGLATIAALPSCKKDEPVSAAEQVLTLPIVSSDHNFLPEGGSGKIVLSEDGFTAKSQDEWITISNASGREITFQVQAMKDIAARTGTITLTKDGRSAELHITQLPTVAYLTEDASSYDIDRFGGEVALPYLDQTGSTPVVTGLPDWITVRQDEGKVVLNVQPSKVPQRNATVHVAIGPVYTKDIRINQVYGELSYEDVLGDYTGTYIKDSAKPEDLGKANFQIVEKDKAKNLYTLKGLAVDLELAYDPKTSSLRINYFRQTIKDGDQTYNLVCGLWGYGFLRPNGKDPHWGLVTDLDNFLALRLTGPWDRKSVSKPSFKFVSPQADGEGFTYRGMLVWAGDANMRYVADLQSKRPAGIVAVADLTLVKK